MSFTKYKSTQIYIIYDIIISNPSKEVISCVASREFVVLVDPAAKRSKTFHM